MSTLPKADPLANTASSTKSKKKNKKKKVGGDKSRREEEASSLNGGKDNQEFEADGDPIDEESESPTEDVTSISMSLSTTQLSNGPQSQDSPNAIRPTIINGLHQSPSLITEKSDSDTGRRLEVLVQERDHLLAEVSQSRKNLEDIRIKHAKEMSTLQEQLEESESGKEQAEAQYSTLLEKVNHIKAQLGERLKADAEELSQARTQIDELEEQNRSGTAQRETLKAEVAKIRSENEKQGREISDLRSRANLSQQNWVKERDELISREAYAREEFENARQTMQDWEVLAMEERTLRENLSDRVAELEDQLSTHREAYERVIAERDTQSSTVDGLQRALQDIQDARKKELREMVEQSQSQSEEMRKRLQTSEEALVSRNTALEATQRELERALPFEKEVKEKNLLIGKLRHEAVILNDHLTKALRFLKQRKPEDMVDRELVTNHFLHFLALDRSDPKKFQILQLIAALLAWSEEQREQAGLARPGTSVGNLRVPVSPFKRIPSTPSLSSEHMLGEGGASKESLAELWSDFLEREASEGKGGSRRPSVASTEKSQSGGLTVS